MDDEKRALIRMTDEEAEIASKVREIGAAAILFAADGRAGVILPDNSEGDDAPAPNHVIIATIVARIMSEDNGDLFQALADRFYIDTDRLRRKREKH